MKNLKALREKKKLTQQNMADFLNIKRPTYTRYETGERQPDYATLVKIANYFHVTTDYLLLNETAYSLNDENSTKTLQNNPNLNLAHKKLLKLDEKQLENAIEYLNFLIYQNNKKNKK